MSVATDHPTDSPVGRVSRTLPLVVGFALFMQTLDSTIITNSLPRMAESFHCDVLQLNLAITSYLLAGAVFLPLSGWIADRFGARAVFRAAIVGFTLASISCGLSDTLLALVASRVAQGACGTLMLPVGRVILIRVVPASELVNAMSYLILPGLLGTLLGPVLGGAIVTYTSWRVIFLINVPIGLLGVVLGSIFIPVIRREPAYPLDWRGFIAVAAGLTGLITGLENIGKGLLPEIYTWVAIAVGFCGFGLYRLHARKRASALLDFSVFAIPSFRIGTLGGLCCRLAAAATPFILALLLQIGLGLTPLDAGLLISAEAIGSFVTMQIAQPIIRKFGYRTTMLVCAAVTSACIFVIAFVSTRADLWWLAVVLFVGGLFRSVLFSSLNALAFSDIPASKVSKTSSLAAMVQQSSQSVGVGVAALATGFLVSGRSQGATGMTQLAPVFMSIAGLSLLSILFFRRLGHDDGRFAVMS